ncbi:MAG: glycosyltransferase [Verrucomicrobiota bacterium]
MHPLVSIIIPCYNAEKWVAEAIQSALDQTWPNKEVIVIDDGSTDGSLALIKSFGERIRWETGPNRGGCAARNRGLRLAQGEWIQYLDADDLLHPKKIAVQMPFVSGRNNVAANGRLVRFSGKSPSCDILQAPECLSFEISGLEFGIRKRLGEICNWINPDHDPMFGHSLAHCWLLPKALVDKIGPWNESLKTAQDNEYFDRLYLVAEHVVFTDGALALYRTGVPGTTSVGCSRKHAESVLRYCNAAEKILERSRSIRITTGLARNYFEFACRFYPKYPDLVDVAFEAIEALKVPPGAEVAAPRLRLARILFGRRMALRLKRFLRLPPLER